MQSNDFVVELTQKISCGFTDLSHWVSLGHTFSSVSTKISKWAANTKDGSLNFQVVYPHKINNAYKEISSQTLSFPKQSNDSTTKIEQK